MKKGRLEFSKGVIVERTERSGGGGSARQVLLPEELTDAFVTCWLGLPNLHPCSLASVGWRVPVSDYKRLARHCCNNRPSNDGIPHLWAARSRAWPYLTEGSGKWDLTRFKIAYRADIGFPLIRSVHITTVDVRLVESPEAYPGGQRLLSVQQFEYYNGRTVVDYLGDYLDSQEKKVRSAIAALESPLRKARVTSADSALRVGSSLVSGPSALPPSDWCLPSGQTFLQEDV